jgi:hypothetical protein
MRQEIQKRIKKKQAELKSYETKQMMLQGDMEKLRAVISELESILRSLPNEDIEGAKAEREPRFGTDVYRAREALRNAGGPLHISQILQAMGEEPTKAKRSSVSSQIAAYAKANAIFESYGGNTFGLKDYGPRSLRDLVPAGTVFAPDLDSADDDSRSEEDIPF